MTQKRTPLDNAKALIKEIEEKRRNDVAVASEKLHDAERELEQANKSLEAATTQMNIDNYADAKVAASHAQTRIEMYSGRLQQIKEQEYISTTDSDRIIDSLLDYEKELEAQLDDAVAEPIEKIRAILTDYLNEVEEVEATLKYWTHNIHVTHKSRNGKKRIDPDTGEYTCVMEKPQRIRFTPYTGGSTAAALKSFLRGISK